MTRFERIKNYKIPVAGNSGLIAINKDDLDALIEVAEAAQKLLPLVIVANLREQQPDELDDLDEVLAKLTEVLNA